MTTSPTNVEPRRLFREDVAALLGLKSPRSLGRVKLPKPDGHVIDRGHARPYWHEATALAFRDARPGKGWRRAASVA